MVQDAPFPYRLIRRLALGGMAELHLAEEKLLPGVSRPVALKQLLSERRSDPEFVTMFFDEARLLAQLSHPGVPKLLSAGEHGGVPFLALEYVEGLTLSELLQSGPLPDPLSALIFLELAEVLTYVHSAHDHSGRFLAVVHRDLTPSNVLIGTNGAITLIDFGIAQGENRVYETSAGVVKGTCGYMAPEQLEEGATIDHRADLFSLGVMLHEAALRQHPFVAKTPMKLLETMSAVRRAEPRTLRADVPDTILTVIDRCLSPAPTNRPQSAYEVAALLNLAVREVGWASRGQLGRYVVDQIPAVKPSGTETPAPTPGASTAISHRRRR